MIMKGLIINELTFEERLAYDDVFSDYFNAFLSLPAFAKVVQYDTISGSFQEAIKDYGSLPLHPSNDAENESKQKEKIMKWVRRDRLPLFLKTRLYLEFKLCRLLIRKLRDSKSTARASSRGLRGYSRATSSTAFSPSVQGNRPSSRVSNQSWPGVPVKNFGRRPLGSATSLPGMLRLAMGSENVTYDVAQDNSDRNLELVYTEERIGALQNISQQMPSGDTEQGVNQEENEENGRTAEISKPLEEHGDDVIANGTAGLKELKEQVTESEPADRGSDTDDESEPGTGDDLSVVMEFDVDNDLDEAQAEADVRSIASRHRVTLQELKEQTLGSLRGMILFRGFLEDTVGIHLYDFWLDAERYKDSLQSEPEDTIRELRTKLFREIQDKYKNYLTVDAKEQIDRALYHGGVTQDLFTRTQYDMLRRLRSYWTPRFLVHLERNEEYGDSYFTYTNPRDQYRPNSNLSFFPTLSLVHSLPPLGDWCREMIRSRKWDRDILIKDKRNKSARRRLVPIPEGSSVDPFISALKAEKDAGCPFKRYLHGREEKSLFSKLLFWLDVKVYYEAEKRSGDRYLSRCSAWNIFNTYMAPGANMNIGLQDVERKRVEKILHSSEELPLKLFKTSENYVVGVLRPVWEDFKDFDMQRYRQPPKGLSDRTSSPNMSGKDGKNMDHYYSPTTGRWVKRHPGSSPSQRGRRLYTSLAMAEEIDAARSMSSSPKLVPAIPPPSHGKKLKGGKTKKKSKALKNVTFDNKKKMMQGYNEEEDSMESKHGKPAQQVVPEFVDVVESKGTMSSFKQYVQNMEGRQATNQLMMYLEIEQYYAILPAKKMQKTQQASHIYKAVSLPSLLVGKAEGDRPSSPVLAEAQQAVLSDIKSYFKVFFKQAQEAANQRESTYTPNTPGQLTFSKSDTFDSSQSFLQFYRKKARKTKNTGRSQPTKEDKEDFKRMLQSTQGRLSVKLEFFRRYLQTHGEPEGFPKLETDFYFYLEVQKFKDLFNYMDDPSLNKKVETIIECFLDSATPPWLQIDIGPELASRIIHKAQVFSSAKRVPREQKDPSMFDEAQSFLFKELLPFWAGFCKQYTEPESEENLKLPLTKQEKILHKRYAEFVKYQAVTNTLVLPPVMPTYGQSKTEVSFSVSDGLRWKDQESQDEVCSDGPMVDRKEVDTASVVSSVAGSIAGGVRKGSTSDGSVQHIEVGS